MISYLDEEILVSISILLSNWPWKPNCCCAYVTHSYIIAKVDENFKFELICNLKFVAFRTYSIVLAQTVPRN